MFFNDLSPEQMYSRDFNCVSYVTETLQFRNSFFSKISTFFTVTVLCLGIYADISIDTLPWSRREEMEFVENEVRPCPWNMRVALYHGCTGPRLSLPIPISEAHYWPKPIWCRKTVLNWFKDFLFLSHRSSSGRITISHILKFKTWQASLSCPKRVEYSRYVIVLIWKFCSVSEHMTFTSI